MTWLTRGVLILVAGFVAVVAGSWGAARTLGAEAGTPDERFAVAQLGDLVETVSASGSLVLPRQEILTFGTAGTLDQLLVQEGATVEAGQVLARLDEASQATLQKNVAQARVTLRNARDALDALTGGADDAALASATVKLDTAQVGLENAQRDLGLTQNEWRQKLDVAQQAVEDVTTDYAFSFERYLGIILTDSERLLDPSALLALWGANLEVLFDSYGASQIRRGIYSDDPTDDPATRWSEAILYAWLNFSGEIPQASVILDDMDAQWETLQDSLAALSADETKAAKALASAEDAVARTQDTLDKALTSLDDLRVPADEIDLSLAQAEVAAAEAALDFTRDLADRAVLVAPFSGVVGPINITAGERVNANAPIVSVVDPSEVELQAAVDEIDVARITVGQEVTITLDALSGVTLQGRVASASLIGQNNQGVVSFPVTIRLQTSQGLLLRQGMTASATITVARQSNVILIPPRSMQGSIFAPTVTVLKNGEQEERSITMSGLTADLVAVTSGLEIGEILVYSGTSGQTGFSGFGSQFRNLSGGGGFGGAGGGLGGGGNFRR